MSAWLLILACGGDADTGTAEVPEEPTTPIEVVDDCVSEPLGSGEPVGEADCSGGVCEVPAGDFVMGAANPLLRDQCPERRVTLGAFAIDETEVTREDYAQCVSAGTCEALPYCESRAPGITDHDALPVTCLTQLEAATYCQYAGGRLPTEAEWEKAARGTEGAIWPWGATHPSCPLANFRFSSGYCNDGPIEAGKIESLTEILPVDSLRSAFGLLDTAGNVWEWTADHYDYTWYRDAPDIDPPGPDSCAMTEHDARGECTHVVMRGGGYNSVQDTIRGHTRSSARSGVRDVNVGVRCAYDR